MKKISKELIGASSIPIILSILSEGESYGYALIQKVKELSDGKVEWGEGTLYPVLHKLEKKKWIVSYWKQSDSGRKRKYYGLSEAGKQELEQEKEQWSVIQTIITKLWTVKPNLA